MTMLLVGAGMVAAFAVALAFSPVEAWARLIPIALAAVATGMIVSRWAAQALGRRLLVPVQTALRAIEDDHVVDDTLHTLIRQSPADLAPVLYGVHLTHTRLHRTQRQLEGERAEVEAIFEYMADGVLVVDGHERVVLSNPAAERILRSRAPLGRGLAEVSHDAELVDLARSAHGRRPLSRVIELYSVEPGADRRYIQAAATLLPENRRLLVLQDLSDVRRAEVARRDFVANVSHELRTPVAALKALVETLKEGAIDDPVEGPHFLERMHVEVDGLAQMVTELLELARAEAGRLELDIRPCRADGLVRDAVERIRPTAARVDLSVEVVVDAEDEEDEEELLVCADARRIGQVLGNLLTNAAKFTPPAGKIQVGTRRRGNFVELWVSDSGVGIEPAQLARVFERFYKTDPSRVRVSGAGTGLGLAIAKHMVLAHGGQIWAESDGPGQGSTFRMALPAATTAA
ncbi:MAG: ATP-binding protein [Chloroflexota bacterium]